MHQRNSRNPQHSQAAPDLTVGKLVAALRRRDQGRAACVEHIKAIHGPARAPVLFDETGTTSSIKPSAIAKQSPSGQLIGWYRTGQTRGRPSLRMPLERAYDEHRAAWARAFQEGNSKGLLAAMLARRSAVVRQRDSLAERIVGAYLELQHAGVPKHYRTKIVARQLRCNVEYVRRVRRQHQAKMPPAGAEKNTT